MQKYFYRLALAAALTTLFGLAFHTAAFAQSGGMVVVEAQAVDATTEPGLLILAVRQDGPAAKAGLKRGDILLKVNDTEINTAQDLQALLADLKAGDKVTLTVLHGDETLELAATLTERDGRTFLGIRPDNPPLIVAQHDTPFGTKQWSQGQLAPLPPDAMTGMTSTLHLQVLEVVKESPAATAGLQAGDLIVAVEGKPLSSEQDFQESVKKHKPGDKITLTIQHGPFTPAQSEAAAPAELTITLGKHPEKADTPYLGVRYAPLMMLEVHGMGPSVPYGNFSFFERGILPPQHGHSGRWFQHPHYGAPFFYHAPFHYVPWSFRFALPWMQRFNGGQDGFIMVTPFAWPGEQVQILMGLEGATPGEFFWQGTPDTAPYFFFGQAAEPQFEWFGMPGEVAGEMGVEIWDGAGSASPLIPDSPMPQDGIPGWMEGAPADGDEI